MNVARAAQKWQLRKGMVVVVASNFAAQRVAAACGFRVLCVLPRAFQHPERGLVDTVLLFNDLSCVRTPMGR
ncbi:unnamed protein product [Cladocopium goreaui]|uniref:Tropomodulin-2 n=1 Tax=Cladocopium goreaui TaxID=2562237 RepID=A0A9P1GC63_9DINO|nr:unnamed protein product [Cladocopium goreaui]